MAAVVERNGNPVGRTLTIKKENLNVYTKRFSIDVSELSREALPCPDGMYILRIVSNRVQTL